MAANSDSAGSALKAVITDRDHWQDPKPYNVLGVSDSFSKVADTATTIVGTTFDPSNATALSMKAMKIDNTDSNDKYCGFLIQNGGGKDSKYGPIMTMTLAPEPATATLSLLALAGLAARRRH